MNARKMTEAKAPKAIGVFIMCVTAITGEAFGDGSGQNGEIRALPPPGTLPRRIRAGISRNFRK
jgi:hypothetical protein